MRIIQVYQSNPFNEGQGGGVRYLRNLSRGLTAAKIEVLFLGVGRKEKLKKRLKFIPITTSHTSYPVFLLRLFLKVPFLRLRKTDIIHVHRVYFAIPFLLLMPKSRIVCTLHGRTFSVLRQRLGERLFGLVEPIITLLEGFCLKGIDFLVPVSDDVIRSFKARHKNFMSHQMKIIGSMFDPKEFPLKRSSFLGDSFGRDRKYILFLGRLAKVKDLDFLIRVWTSEFRSSRAVSLIIAGTGEEEARLKNLVDASEGPNKPIFIGEVDTLKVASVLSSASVLVLCSEHEASPTVVKESLCLGTPVVTTNVGDVALFIKNGINGKIVAKDIEQFSKAINEILQKELNSETVALSSGSLLSSCTVEGICNQYKDIYQRLSQKDLNQTDHLSKKSDDL